MAKAIGTTILVILLYAGILFGAAGRLDWRMAWVFLLAYLGVAVTGFVVVDPTLIRERVRGGAGINRCDVALASLGFAWLFPVTLLVAGLDAGRFGWSPPMAWPVRGSGLGLFLLGNGFALWAMRTNRFFSTFVRIQTDRGHRLVTTGPYAAVRHPGYAGALMAAVAAPILLGSWWALVPALVGCAVFALRTWHEDETLKRELEGYREYCTRVRWRLVPGVW